MKILHLTTSKKGGAGLFTLDMERHFNKSGHINDVFSFNDFLYKGFIRFSPVVFYNLFKTFIRVKFSKKIDRKLVVCKTQERKDRYNRYIGVCFTGELNLNKWMVRNGYAVAFRRYSKNYIEDENYARKNKLGLWSGSFIHPEKWRKVN